MKEICSYPFKGEVLVRKTICRLYVLSLVALCLASLSGCSRNDESGQCSPGAHAPARQAIILGIDGLRADALRPELAPFLLQLADSRGVAWTQVDVSNGRTQQTFSAPGWITVLTGSWAREHGIVDNDSRGPVKVPTVFERLQASNADSRSLFITSWKPLYKLLLERSPGGHHAGFLRQDDIAVEQQVLTTWRACQPDLAFIHLDAVDQAGHAHAFDPADPAYAAAVRETDARVRRIWEQALAVPSPQGEMPERMVVLVSDHGGVDNHHGRYSDVERMAPLLVLVPAGYPEAPIGYLTGVGQSVLSFIGVSQK